MISNNLVILLIILFYSGYNLFIKLSSNHTSIENNNILSATLILQFTALITTLSLSSKIIISTDKFFILSFKSYIYAILGGICIAAAEIGYFYIFSNKNSSLSLNASSTIPIVIGGTICITFIFSYLFLNEEIYLQNGIGVILNLIGITLIFIKPKLF